MAFEGFGEIYPMCRHRNGDPEDCILEHNPDTNQLHCAQHPHTPTPRNRTDGLDILVPLLQQKDQP